MKGFFGGFFFFTKHTPVVHANVSRKNRNLYILHAFNTKCVFTTFTTIVESKERERERGKKKKKQSPRVYVVRASIRVFHENMHQNIDRGTISISFKFSLEFYLKIKSFESVLKFQMSGTRLYCARNINTKNQMRSQRREKKKKKSFF